ncbi:MAG: glycyl-radical enzyme activating protein [Desulfovibrionaceae bacterium]|nr:glycyl-radical enzyme activating protein [Desulfovibrionaceae bacterium]
MQKGMVYNIQRMSTEDGPGMRTTVFLKGCPLRCLWCSNPESQKFTPQLMVFEDLCTGCGHCAEACPSGAIVRKGDKFNRDTGLCTDCGACVPGCPSKARVMTGEEMSVEEILKVVKKDELFYANSGGGVTIGGGEPVSSGDFLLDLLQGAYDAGLHICVDTCGFCPEERFKKVIERTDLFLFDCKHMDPEKHKEMTGVDNAQILANLRQALESRAEVRIRIPLMPGLNDSEENIAALAEFLRPFRHMNVDVLPYHAFGRNKYAALNLEQPTMETYAPEALKAVLALFEKHGLKAEIA